MPYSPEVTKRRAERRRRALPKEARLVLVRLAETSEQGMIVAPNDIDASPGTLISLEKKGLAKREDGGMWRTSLKGLLKARSL